MVVIMHVGEWLTNTALERGLCGCVCTHFITCKHVIMGIAVHHTLVSIDVACVA
jgi:hypothetical protein